ncbi:hypothetical protein, partial [Gynurincola endophyticus]
LPQVVVYGKRGGNAVQENSNSGFYFSNSLGTGKFGYNKGDGFFKRVGKFAANTVSDVWNGVVGTADAVLHPIQTLDAVVNGVEGLIKYIDENSIEQIISDAGEKAQDPHFWEGMVA